MPADLTDADQAEFAALLRQAIAADRFPLSPRVRRWKAILDKLEPTAPKPAPLPPLKPPAPKPAPLPPLKPPGEPSMVVARMRGTKRRR